MGAAAQIGAETPILVLVGLGTGLICGAFNGVLVTRLGLPSIVPTIGTMSLFRGISYIVLGIRRTEPIHLTLPFLGKVMFGGSFHSNL